MGINQKTDFIPDLPAGPLDEYRKQASFCWKQMRLVFEEPELLKIKMAFWKTLESDDLFHMPGNSLSPDKQKHLAALQLIRFHTLGVYTDEVAKYSYRNKTRRMMTLNEATACVSTDLSVKIALGVSLFCNSLLSLGTERHLPLYHAAWRGDLLSCIALTEVGHGSNTKCMRTTATYDCATQSFVIHTPDFQAAKCWVGNLGKTCTWALVFAQLVTAENTCHGLHAFVIPIRDPKTLLPYPGILLGDIGEKIGLNGIDNGFLVFDNYRVSRESLLNRMSDVTPEGEYETSFSNPEQQLGAALETLSAGRVGIMLESANTMCQAVTIAVRYAAVRKQFGPNGQAIEYPLIEYQLHQWRLIPYVAATCALKIFISAFTDQYLEIVEQSNSNSGAKLRQLSLTVSEIHAMVSACKPLVTWTCRDAIQESREACGGHGYLAASGLGHLRNNHDPKVTYEGDNNVLVQQTSNWLLRQWGGRDGSVESPFGSATFLSRAAQCKAYRFEGTAVQHVTNHKFIQESYEWLLCWLLAETERRLQQVEARGEDKFNARNQSQVYRARTLSLAYGENNALVYFWNKCCSPDLTPPLRPVLKRLYYLYGLSCLDKHLTILYQGGYATGPQLAELVREGILQLCTQLKPDVVAIVDALAPPDFALHSVLGKADGKVYERLQTAFFHNPGAMERPSWWKDLVHKGATTSKL